MEDLLIELDDIDVEDDEDEVIPGKVGKSLPLTTPTIAPERMPGTMVMYREEVMLTAEAERLFDFSKTKLSPIQQLAIMGYAQRGTKMGAAKVANVPVATLNKWLENDEFMSALQTAMDMVRDTLEEELMRRAMDGSDKLLLEAIKAAKPEKYNKKQSDVNIHGTMVHTWADLAKQAAVDAPAIPAEFEEA